MEITILGGYDYYYYYYDSQRGIQSDTVDTKHCMTLVYYSTVIPGVLGT